MVQRAQLAKLRRVESKLKQAVRREKKLMCKRRSYQVSVSRRWEDVAFVLFCSQKRQSATLHLCLQEIVSPSPDLKAETLLERLQDRYMQTPKEHIAEIVNGHGGIPEKVHGMARKLWQHWSAVQWVRYANVELGAAPSWQHIWKQLVEPPRHKSAT